MKKAIARRTRPLQVILTASLLAVAYAQGCAGTHKSDHVLPFPMSSEHVTVKESWTRETSGFITDLNLARDTGSVLVTTRPDYDRPEIPKHFLVTLHDAKGKVKWQQTLPFQVKSQDVARDGSLVVVTHYNNEIIAFDAEGKRAWSREGNCRPLVLESVKRIICYHDDDAQAGTVFEVLDWAGQSLGARSVKLDLLSIKSSQDERSLVTGLTRGLLEFYDLTQPLKGAQVKPTWKHTLDGEILDVAVSSGESPRVAVLYNVQRIGQHVAWFDSAGKLLGKAFRPTAHVTQIELMSDGNGIVLYGNTPRGQNLIYLDGAPVGKVGDLELSEKWKVAEPRFADYSTAMNVMRDLIIIGFEDFADNTRTSRLVGFGRDGKVRFTVPLETTQGAYLYSHTFSPAKELIVIGTDDSQLSGYHVNP